jgi:hypothetical protein
MPNETCILCGNETTVDINTHVDFRIGYIEGAGQLCISCYQKGNQSSREHITIPKDYVLNYPNDSELGAKVRQYYYENYGIDNTPPTKNIWICEYCGGDTSQVDSDYVVNTNHLECVLKMNP